MGVKRIRYVPCATGWVSANILKAANGKEYKASMNTTGTEGAIEPLNPEEPTIRVKANSAHILKILLKDRLVQLGVSFEDESRKKKGTDGK